MPEDQGVNGDAWTEEACRLFSAARWHKIGDSNIDIDDSAGNARGLDAIFSYKDGFQPSISRGVFLEAKKWATTSLREDKLHGWISGLSEKVSGLRNSAGLLQGYQETQNLEISTGVIACYFSDTTEYNAFEPKLKKWLINLKVPYGHADRAFHPRILFLENRRLLWLASLLSTIKDWIKSAANGETRTVNFFYPSAALHGNPTGELDCLNIEYILSSIVLAKGVSRVDAGNQITVKDFVFYSGPLDTRSFGRVAKALQSVNMIDVRNELLIYKYRRETEEFRKIKPDVVTMFKALGANSLEIKDMDSPQVMPAWVLNGE